MKYIKSPLNYIGGKFKLLPQILPLFPKEIDTFVDLFGGGGNVFINANAKRYIYNDINDFMVDMFRGMNAENYIVAIGKINSIVSEYELSKTNIEGFKKLRDKYNEGNNEWHFLYTLMCFSFNNQYRFNNKKEYNSSFGHHKCCYGDTTKDKLQIFINELHSKDVEFTCMNFKEFNFNKLTQNDFVYLDPPYTITVGNYNDGKRGFDGWCEADDIVLTNLLDHLTNNGVKWAMSNVLTHKGKENYILTSWCERNKDKYIVHHLNHSYSNCNYHDKTGNNGQSDEVLICNYHKCGDCINFGSDCMKNMNDCDYTI